MHRLISLFLLLICLQSLGAHAYDIGLIPLNDFSETQPFDYGKNISLKGSPEQINSLKKWIREIARVPKGHETLISIQQSGHKLFIIHSPVAMISSGKTSAPVSQNLINGKGESVDILFNAEIPDQGSHRVYTRNKQPIEFTAVQNLYHELSHADHMMNGRWLYFKSEYQAIEDENEFRRQLSDSNNQPFLERVYVKGEPICPLKKSQIQLAWNQQIICKIPE